MPVQSCADLPADGTLAGPRRRDRGDWDVYTDVQPKPQTPPAAPPPPPAFEIKDFSFGVENP